MALISRRRFLSALTLIGAYLPFARGNESQGKMEFSPWQSIAHSDKVPMKKIGLALGAGGAKGLAHILMLEAFDELGIKPHIITGSSMGAVIGALYASGRSGKEIRKFVNGLVISSKESWSEALLRKDILKWIEFIDPELGKGGLIDGENFIQYVHKELQRTSFEELAIPLKVVTADFWRREQIVLESGQLLAAIKASMAVPGLFAPVSMDNRVLVDGGMVNPVPYDLLFDDCDITIAIDVMGSTSVQTSAIPSFFDAIFNAVHIMQQSILAEKMKNHRPDIYIRPHITDIRMLDFISAELIYQQAMPAKEQLKKELEKALS